MGRVAGWHDLTVYSNGFYALVFTGGFFSAATALDMAFVGAFGAALAAGSALYHARYTRPSQRADVATMLGFVGTLALVIGRHALGLGPALLLLAFPIAAAYWRYTGAIDSYVHVPVLAGIALLALFFVAGPYALVALGLFAAGGAIKRIEPHADAPIHAAWHFCTAAAGWTALFFL